MNSIGLDACKYGWCGIGKIERKLVWGCYSKLDDVIKSHPSLDRILIDIPIGLSSKSFKRTVDVEARKLLNKRKSSIFSPPCREALYAKNYKQALSINRTIEGKGISVQAYNIGEKIKEIDEWLDSQPKNIEIFEAHPELCFKTLNKNQDILLSKHDIKGIEIRKNIIYQHHGVLKDTYSDFLINYKRSEVKPDDILDAMALHLTAISAKKIKFVQDKNKVDETGKEIKIVYG